MMALARAKALARARARALARAQALARALAHAQALARGRGVGGMHKILVFDRGFLARSPSLVRGF